jgi:Flp pilus assembly protein TadG
MHAPQPGRSRRGEAGASAIEFAFVLPVFLILLYGIASYGLAFALSQVLTFAAEEGARAVVAADPAEPDYLDTAADLARTTVAERLAWLPASQRAVILGADNANVGVTFEDHGSGVEAVTVTVRHASYAESPLIPVLILPGIGSIPPLPSQIGAQAQGRI